MQALFVHGMGRTSLSGWPMLRQLRKAGIRTATFDYFVSLQSFAETRERLAKRIAELAGRDDYILIGHSLGGVLVRAALAELPGVRAPKHVFLLGSPVLPSRLAQQLRARLLFRIATGDCGELLGSAERMRAIAGTHHPVTSIVGVKGLSGRASPFGSEPNDGVVAVSEASAAWIADQVRLPVVHTLLPASPRVAQVVLDRLGMKP